MGTHLCYRPVTIVDLPQIHEWEADPETTKYMFRGAMPNQRFEIKGEEVVYLLYLEKEEPVGIIGLHSINWIARSAELRLILGTRNRGYGTQACKWMVSYAFETLNLNKVWLGTNAENTGAVRCFEKAGFQHEGILRREIFRNNCYYDAARMGILRDDNL